jgi:hypothetical protein
MVPEYREKFPGKMRPILNDKILKTIMRQKDQNIGY